ncbi:hypothetical protein N836_32670 [Leptolyngbya sp. Heron Island J]|uniref:DsrE family protein n=1 Tax=Leptolyngbya sp. Heron Island J TaxID=1385935 RepID=UPI0003B98896|nr:DsrE family protein [Leptolyngbya sp. Heron Island J]ESA38185.1 hypothetical protein N836_32670 [Leptolyngbya sp. Heron Island J]
MAATTRDGLFIHISRGAENPQRILMALTLAEMMAEDEDVLIFFDIKGVAIPLKGSKPIEFREFESTQTLLPKLIEKGIHMCVCPMCLKVAGHKPDDLLEGVELAEKHTFFNFTQGRILSLNY